MREDVEIIFKYFKKKWALVLYKNLCLSTLGLLSLRFLCKYIFRVGYNSVMYPTLDPKSFEPTWP